MDEASANREAGGSTPSWGNPHRRFLVPPSTEELGWSPKRRASRAALLDSMARTHNIVRIWERQSVQSRPVCFLENMSYERLVERAVFRNYSSDQGPVSIMLGGQRIYVRLVRNS